MKEIVSESRPDSRVEVHNPQWYRALSLTERLASLRMRSASQAGEQTVRYDLAAQRLLRWQEQDAFKKGIDFSQRLAADQLSLEDFQEILGEPCEALQQRVPVPDWLERLAEIFADSPLSHNEATPGDTTEPSKLTLLNTFDLFARYGREQLTQAIAALAQEFAYLPFDPENIAGLFLPNLSSALLFVHRTLALELNVARLQDRLQGETSEERFQDFISQTREKSALLSLLEEYPVLARLLVSALQRWLDYTLELLSHLCADWQQLCGTFFAHENPGFLVAAEGGVGDTHRGGRSVVKLTFASGRKLMYKPKSLAVDVHFQELLAWLNARGNQPDFRITIVLDRGTYGWCEYIEARGCTTQAEIARFYERQGAYLALLYALNATDFHFENLIASGEHPVLIDLEALFHARLNDEFVVQRDVASLFLNYSVMRVGLLPNRVFANNVQQGLDISGLGGKGGQQTPIPVMRWSEEGTDQMHLQRQYQNIPGKSNRPKLGEEEVDLLDYRGQVRSGFTQMYRLLIAQRDALIAGPLARFEHDEIRCIMRATNFYGHLLQESYHPGLFSDALNRDRHFDHLWLSTLHNPHLLKLLAAERRDLLVGDIPMFTSYPFSCDIYTSRQERIPNFFSTGSMEMTQKTLLSLSESDLERQLWFIHASFASMLMGQGLPTWMRPTITAPTGKEVTHERLLQAARAVGDRLCELAIGDEKGVNWVGLSLVQERQWMLTAANPDLYSGNTGIMLFLSYLGALTGEARYTDMVEAAYITLYQQLEQMKNPLMKVIGAYDGWGSVIYLLSHLGTLWHDPTLLAEAQEIVARLPAIIADDPVFDVLSGSAGCILSLASLYRVDPSPAILAAAVQCGEHLLTHAQKQQTGLGWLNPSMSARPLTGFSHGAAGGALSLLVLADMSGEERFRLAALEALAYERSMFSPQEQNWPDLRDLDDFVGELKAAGKAPGEESYMLSWCHGAPGIGLSRLAALRYLDDAQIREETRLALQKTAQVGFGQNHSLCHGDLGNLETLLTATQILQEPIYEQQLHHFTGLILDSIEKDGWLTGIPLGVEAPGLMTGLAGIGYELLRLAEPERVPSVLQLAPPITPEA